MKSLNSSFQSNSGSIYVALLAAALVPALVFGAISGKLAAAIPAFMVTMCFSVVLGLPTYLYLNKRGLVFWWTSILSGGIIGVVPTAVLFILTTAGSENHWLPYLKM